MADQSTQTTLSPDQIEVIDAVLKFLEQFCDRDQMQAGAYLAKYKNAKACEEIGIHLKWAIEREFKNV